MIYSPSITQNLTNIFLIYIKRNFSWTKQILNTSFLYLLVNKKFWQWSLYQRLQQTQWLPISYRQFTWLSGDVSRLPSYDVYISHLVKFARCCTSVLDFHCNNLQNTLRLLTQGHIIYHTLRKAFGKFFTWHSEILSKFNEIRISFWRNLSPCLLWWSSLQTKERQISSEFCLVMLENS